MWRRRRERATVSARPGSTKYFSAEGRQRCFSFAMSWQRPCSHGLAHLFECGHITGQCLTIGELIGAISAFGIQIIEQAGRATLVSILADVAGFLGLIDVATL